MSRDVPFDEEAVCDECGATGAFDFYCDHLCPKCVTFIKEMVVGFAFSGREVLLIRKRKPDWQAGQLNGVGGKIKSQESATQAMFREFLEEAGLKVLPRYRWQKFCTITGVDHTWRVYFFRTTLFDHEKGYLTSRTEEKLEWHRVDALPDDTINNLHWLIPMALARSPVVAIVREII